MTVVEAFEEVQHPRNRLGKWIDVVGKLHAITRDDV
jgi:hypothetical protein